MKDIIDMEWGPSDYIDRPHRRPVYRKLSTKEASMCVCGGGEAFQFR